MRSTTVTSAPRACACWATSAGPAAWAGPPPGRRDLGRAGCATRELSREGKAKAVRVLEEIEANLALASAHHAQQDATA
ncbi:hypothetical protein [Streptomyces bluensis]|uniref:Uncharacterized protein n=1 Tax=Streptomyces bluensis TaxID=33897 RepID=A0ABW6UHN6_9ACTN